MLAMLRRAWGEPDVLRQERVPLPVPGPGEVLVRVRAAGVDRGAWHLLTGRPYLMRLAFGLRRPKHAGLGMDLAGTVAALGAGVEDFAVGDEVFGVGIGTYAEFARARADKLVRKPGALSFEEAASVPISGMTALQGLRDAGRLERGQRVLIIGAGGGVGSFAVQIAKAWGGEVTGLEGPTKQDFVRALGADRALDHSRHSLAAEAGRYDLILDTAGHRSLRALRRLLAPRGTLVIVGSETGGRWLGGVDRQLRAMLMSPFVRQRLTTFVSPERAEDLRVLADLAIAGSLRPAVDRVLPLAEAAAAFAHLTDGHPRGKVVLRV